MPRSLALALVGVLYGAAAGQEVPLTPLTPAEQALLPPAHGSTWWCPPPDDGSSQRKQRLRLFHMPTGFLSDPLGIDPDNDLTPADVEATTMGGGGAQDSVNLPVQFGMGTDNPFFDFRRPGEPGGVGFYKWYSQLQVFDTGKTGLTLGFQAVTPAGLEADGVNNGPTFISPALAWFHELQDGTGFQGFVGKDVRVDQSRWSDHLDRSVQYGMAIHHPVPGFDAASLPNLHVFVEALGRYRTDADGAQNIRTMWEVLPGLHWRVGDAWWLSGGVIVPLGVPRPDARLWQVTCSWQF
jgi:hypothetical protein